MRPGDITYLLCLFCVLFCFYVNSQTSCGTGWFGSKCNYKCHCTNTCCDATGRCTGSSRCQPGWFGPACQYADLAYQTLRGSPITDGDDSTCENEQVLKTLVITLNESTTFTWLRVRVRKADTLADLTVAFFLDSTAVSCASMKTFAVDEKTLDMHCNLTDTINRLTLDGDAVSNLCSVSVSGGRNVALKENASQESVFFSNLTITHQYINSTADKAVDGGTNQMFAHMSCSHTHNTTTWTLRLSRERCVDRYILYNRMDSHSDRLIGVKVESFDSSNHLVFEFKDSNPNWQTIYKMKHTPLNVQVVKVIATNDRNSVTLCEVEIYGDSICVPGQYGRDCEHRCNCLDNETCFGTTGGCPSGCRMGFHGEGCESLCPPESYGSGCQYTCSESCAKDTKSTISCKDMQGSCSYGCTDGYMGVTCAAKCDFGKFGKDCVSSCSVNCAPSKRPDQPTCNHVTGACAHGCKRGFIGSFCQKEKTYNYFGVDFIIAVCCVASLAFCLLLCLCKRKRRTKPSSESKPQKDVVQEIPAEGTMSSQASTMDPNLQTRKSNPGFADTELKSEEV